MEIIHNIDEVGRKKGCPTGQCCDICNLYRPLYKNGEGGKVTQIWDCTWVNLTVLAGESKDRILGVQQAVESTRNETVKRQDIFNKIVADGSQEAQKKKVIPYDEQQLSDLLSRIDQATQAIEDQKRLS